MTEHRELFKIVSGFSYYVLILTNKNKDQLVTEATGDFVQRMHSIANDANESTHGCKHLVYFEGFSTSREAIEREKEINKMSKKKKQAIITGKNPGWKFLDEEVNKTGKFQLL